MKKVIVVFAMLLLSLSSIKAEVIFTPDPAETWGAYMNWFQTPANGGGWVGGDVWGADAIRANFIEGDYLFMQLNTSQYLPGDDYWVDPETGLGNKTLEGNFYREFQGFDFAGQDVTLNFRVKSNDLPDGVSAVAFIKILDPGSGWATVLHETEELTVGNHSFSVFIDSAYNGLVLQAGFSIMGLGVSPDSPEAATGVVIGYYGGQPPISPVPVNNAGVLASLDTLSWSNPDPNNPAEPITAAAYLYESDTLLPADPNLGPDLFDEGTQSLVVAEGQESASVSLEANKHYYWRIYVTDTGTGDTVAGPIWYFQTADSAPESVSAGVDQYVWLEDGSTQFTLTATYNDDDKSEVAVLWEDISNPLEQAPGTTVTINNPASAETTVDVDGDGWYLFQVTVSDAVGSGTDQSNVGVYVNACEAAKADPTDIGASYPAGHGDIDGDCDTDLVDFALLAGSWLECMSEKLGCN